MGGRSREGRGGAEVGTETEPTAGGCSGKPSDGDPGKPYDTNYIVTDDFEADWGNDESDEQNPEGTPARKRMVDPRGKREYTKDQRKKRNQYRKRLRAARASSSLTVVGSFVAVMVGMLGGIAPLLHLRKKI